MATPLTSDVRRQALDAVLASEIFRRSDQLKRLLAYLFEQEELGRIHEVTEYELGTRALGRPAAFAPDTDSTVRTRMHSLRQKLDEYHQGNAAGLRLELPKGAYRLRFAEAAPPPPAPPVKRRWLLGASGVAAVASAAAGAVAWRSLGPTPLDRLWAPMLKPASPPVLLVGQPVHLWVRDVQGQADPLDYVHLPDPLPASRAFQDYLRRRFPAPTKAVLHPSPNATLWGDAAGAAAAARFLGFRQVAGELLPESALKGNIALRGRAVLAFGRPEYSPVIHRYLEAANGFTVGMLNSIRRYAIYRRSHPAEHYLNTQPPNEVNYGLITVADDGGGRIFVFSGITSDGTSAGLDYLTSEASVNQLWARLAREGHRDWPTAFQVVVRVSSSSGYAIAARYEKHLLLKR
ncbi:MAG: hypothetical protein K2X03_03405 [Bryobacteraceae bacterium]|nr:hypothetical protein [Bryobacteraceae bacterium]